MCDASGGCILCVIDRHGWSRAKCKDNGIRVMDAVPAPGLQLAIAAGPLAPAPAVTDLQAQVDTLKTQLAQAEIREIDLLRRVVALEFKLGRVAGEEVRKDAHKEKFSRRRTRCPMCKISFISDNQDNNGRCDACRQIFCPNCTSWCNQCGDELCGECNNSHRCKMQEVYDQEVYDLEDDTPLVAPKWKRRKATWNSSATAGSPTAKGRELCKNCKQELPEDDWCKCGLCFGAWLCANGCGCVPNRAMAG